MIKNTGLALLASLLVAEGSTTVDFPWKRYTSWDDLDSTTKGHAKSLGYNEDTWNWPGDAGIEEKRFSNLNDDQKQAVWSLGMNRWSWDCYIHHFEQYDWEEIQKHGFVSGFKGLGWTNAAWLGNANPPESDDLAWGDLSAGEQQAASSICYFREIWNGKRSIPNFPNGWEPYPRPVTSSPTSAPTKGPTTSPSEQPTGTPTTEPTPNPTQEPTPGPTAAPTTSPSDSPTSAPTSSPTTSPSESPTPYDPTEYWDNGIAYTDFRYIPYDTLDADTYALAQALGYDSNSWDNLSESEVEFYDFESLTGQHQALVLGIGYKDKMAWDCNINHFFNYEWEKLAEVGFQSNFIALGWDESSWNGEIDEPESEETPWEDLTDAEQQAAGGLCFFEENWNQDMSIPEWPANFAPPFTAQPSASPSAIPSDSPSMMPTGVPSTSPTDAPTTMPSESPSQGPTIKEPEWWREGVSFPETRFSPFESLPVDLQKVAENIYGYSNETWNYPGTADVEDETYDSLESNQQSQLKKFGFQGMLDWDCNMNHFAGYDWADLKDVGAVDAFRGLGWSQKAWNGEIDPPTTEGAPWEDLNVAQRRYATLICYFQEVWDGSVSISDWPKGFGPEVVRGEIAEDAALTSPPTGAPTKKPSNLNKKKLKRQRRRRRRRRKQNRKKIKKNKGDGKKKNGRGRQLSSRTNEGRGEAVFPTFNVN